MYCQYVKRNKKMCQNTDTVIVIEMSFSRQKCHLQDTLNSPRLGWIPLRKICRATCIERCLVVGNKLW